MNGVDFSVEFLGAISRPGLAPAGDSLSLASPRESKQREGDPQSGSLRFASGNLRCSKQAGSAQTRCAQTARGPNPPVSALLSPAWTGWGPRQDFQYQCRFRTTPPIGNQCAMYPQKQSRKHAPWRVLAGFGNSDVLEPTPLCAKTSSAREGGSGAHMFERSEFMRTPPALSNAVARSEAQGLAHSARLFFAYFLLAKQKKVSRLPGRNPACAPNKRAKNEVRATSARQRKPHRSGERK
jgi:hypothetical protein